MIRRVIVCGSRGWTDAKAVEDALSAVWANWGYLHMVLVHGACPTGADEMAEQWRMQQDCVSSERYLAEWSKHGKKAGPMRNQFMADAGADLCLAFWDGESRGTLDMIKRATKAGIPVRIVPAALPGRKP